MKKLITKQGIYNLDNIDKIELFGDPESIESVFITVLSFGICEDGMGYFIKFINTKDKKQNFSLKYENSIDRNKHYDEIMNFISNKDEILQLSKLNVASLEV